METQTGAVSQPSPAWGDPEFAEQCKARQDSSSLSFKTHRAVSGFTSRGSQHSSEEKLAISPLVM